MTNIDRTLLTLIKEKNLSETLFRGNFGLEKEAELFRSRFPTVTENPFVEIREKLMEYSAAIKTIERIQNGIVMFVKEHGIVFELH